MKTLCSDSNLASESTVLHRSYSGTEDVYFSPHGTRFIFPYSLCVKLQHLLQLEEATRCGNEAPHHSG